MKYDRLLIGISYINSATQKATARAVNQVLTLRNWLIGAYIIEYEQNGEDRAVYGDALLRGIATDLTKQEVTGLSLTNLKSFRKFALIYPYLAKGQTASDFFSPFSNQPSAIGQTASGQLDQSPEIRQNPPLQADSSPIEEDSEQDRLDFEFPSLEIRIAESQVFPWQTPEYYSGFFKAVSWSHLVELCRLDEPTKRAFYELECVRSSWSIRELRRQINSMLYERVGLSKDKEAVLAMTNQGRLIDSPKTILRDPYVLDFLGLEEKHTYSESELEQALINHLQQFMHELGRDFCFVDRQFRILIGGRSYYLDLLFYHRSLRCLIAIDLKLGEFRPDYAGQMNLYLNYLKEEIAYPDENPPVGILLCANRDAEEVHFATAGMDNQLFVSRYMVALPSEEKLRHWLQEEQHRLNQLHRLEDQ